MKIIFDVGNVVVKGNHAITHRNLRELGVKDRREKYFFDNEHYRKFSRGNIDGQTFYESLIRKYLKCELSYQEIVDAHNNHMHGVDENVLGILTQLNKKDLVFLTDTNQWQTEREQELIDLRLYSDKIIRSNEINRLKIDENCFPYVMQKLEVKPGDALFVDDNEKIISLAKKYGLITLQFTDSIQLIRSLKNKNLI